MEFLYHHQMENNKSCWDLSLNNHLSKSPLWRVIWCTLTPIGRALKTKISVHTNIFKFRCPLLFPSVYISISSLASIYLFTSLARTIFRYYWFLKFLGGKKQRSHLFRRSQVSFWRSYSLFTLLNYYTVTKQKMPTSSPTSASGPNSAPPNTNNNNNNPPPEVLAPLIPKRKAVGDYRIGKTIGEGAFSKVKLGYHKVTGEKVGWRSYHFFSTPCNI